MKNFVIGNIYSIHTNSGLGIFQLVDIPKDKENEVEMVKVSYQLFSEIPSDFEKAFEEGFFYVCFPVKAALKRKLIEFVGYEKLPANFKIPRFYRTRHYFNRNEWIIVDKETNEIEQVKELTDDNLKLSPDGVWNDTLLKERLEEGWRLENWK